MSTPDLAEAASAHITALESQVYAIADACPDRAALRTAFDVYAAESEAGTSGLPVGDGCLELLRMLLAGLGAVIEPR